MSNKNEPAPPVRIIRLPEVLEQLSVCTSKLYVLMGAKQFPRPIKIGRSSRWLQTDVDDYLAKLIKTQRGN